MCVCVCMYVYMCVCMYVLCVYVAKTLGVPPRSCCLLHRKEMRETSFAKEEDFSWVLQPRRWQISLKSISLTTIRGLYSRNVPTCRKTGIRGKEEQLVNRKQVVC